MPSSSKTYAHTTNLIIIVFRCSFIVFAILLFVKQVFLYVVSFICLLFLFVLQETSQNSTNAEGGRTSTPTSSASVISAPNASNTDSNTATPSDSQTSNATTDPSGRSSPPLGGGNNANANKKKKKGKPKLTLLCVRDDSVAECLFDTFTGNRITFQFGIKEDAPEDIAQKMVSFCGNLLSFFHSFS